MLWSLVLSQYQHVTNRQTDTPHMICLCCTQVLLSATETVKKSNRKEIINWIVYRCRSGTLKCYARHEMSCAMTGSKDSIIQLQRRWEKIFVKLGEKNSVKKQPAIELVECEELRHCYSSQRRRRRRRTTSLVSGSTRKSASTEHGVFLDHSVSFSFSLFGPFWRHWYVIAAADAVYACSVIVLD